VYVHTYPKEPDHSSSFKVVDRFCEPIKNKSFTVHTNCWFTSPTFHGHLWALSAKGAESVTSNRKEMPKEPFSNKLKKGEKLSV
jgi:hypothetical protein